MKTRLTCIVPLLIVATVLFSAHKVACSDQNENATSNISSDVYYAFFATFQRTGDFNIISIPPINDVRHIEGTSLQWQGSGSQPGLSMSVTFSATGNVATIHYVIRAKKVNEISVNDIQCDNGLSVYVTNTTSSVDAEAHIYGTIDYSLTNWAATNVLLGEVGNKQINFIGKAYGESPATDHETIDFRPRIRFKYPLIFPQNPPFGYGSQIPLSPPRHHYLAFSIIGICPIISVWCQNRAEADVNCDITMVVRLNVNDRPLPPEPVLTTQPQPVPPAVTSPPVTQIPPPVLSSDPVPVTIFISGAGEQTFSQHPPVESYRDSFAATHPNTPRVTACNSSNRRSFRKRKAMIVPIMSSSMACQMTLTTIWCLYPIMCALDLMEGIIRLSTKLLKPIC